MFDIQRSIAKKEQGYPDHERGGIRITLLLSTSLGQERCSVSCSNMNSILIVRLSVPIFVAQDIPHRGDGELRLAALVFDRKVLGCAFRERNSTVGLVLLAEPIENSGWEVGAAVGRDGPDLCGRVSFDAGDEAWTSLSDGGDDWSAVFDELLYHFDEGTGEAFHLADFVDEDRCLLCWWTKGATNDSFEGVHVD